MAWFTGTQDGEAHSDVLALARRYSPEFRSGCSTSSGCGRDTSRCSLMLYEGRDTYVLTVSYGKTGTVLAVSGTNERRVKQLVTEC